MQWLMHGPMTVAVADALRRHGHTVHELAELGLPPEGDVFDVLKFAEQRQWEVVTTDGALAEAAFRTDFPVHRAIVLLQLEGGDVEQDDAIDRLFARYKRLTPGRLYRVTTNRVKIRQLPGRKS